MPGNKTKEAKNPAVARILAVVIEIEATNKEKRR
jgi:hypothetical protein